MKIENIKRMLDSFYEAGRVLDYLPRLPEGVNISYNSRKNRNNCYKS